MNRGNPEAGGFRRTKDVQSMRKRARLPMAPSLALAFAISLMFALVPAAFGAEEQTSEHTVIGLFSPDREQDLRDVVANVPDVQLVNIDFESARATFRYDVAALFPDRDPKKPPTPAEIEQRLSTLLSNASEATFTLKLSPSLPKEKLSKIAITLGTCDCKGCRYAVYMAVSKVEGVEQATIGKDSIVTVWVDPAKADRTVVENALKKLERK